MVDNHKSNQGREYNPEAWCAISARFSNMADKGFPNVDDVFGEKEGRYDLKKLPKLVHSKKKGKPIRRKKRKPNSYESQGISDIPQTAQNSSDYFENINCDDNSVEVEEPTTSTFEVRDLACLLH